VNVVDGDAGDGKSGGDDTERRKNLEPHLLFRFFLNLQRQKLRRCCQISLKKPRGWQDIGWILIGFNLFNIWWIKPWRLVYSWSKEGFCECYFEFYGLVDRQSWFRLEKRWKVFPGN
jgi:hypothetical protein